MIKRVLGIKIDDVSLKDALVKVKESFKTKKSFLIVTPGPEFLLTAQKDLEFKKILNEADLSLPDGFGLHLAGIKNRVPGVDFMLALCQLSAENNWPIRLVGRTDGLVKDVVQKTISKLRLIYPNIKVDNKNPDILFVGLGHPEQEKFLWNCKLNIARCSFRVGMGVGGAFDYISGELPRPNKLFHFFGLEWLGRLLSRPNRWKRILKATIVFPLVLLLDRGKIRS